MPSPSPKPAPGPACWQACYVKYIAQAGEVGVKVFGPIHGGLFLLYLAAVLLTARELGWSRATITVGLACAVPPFATIWFERRQMRRERALQPAAQPAVQPAVQPATAETVTGRLR
ncbi:DUF3817 domain-containing protein [Nonomuraea sp. NPDC049152]|uniref:DUF3817 domain-containing protein n=1 Tax=Nonomuraea sp. NPDC049152 TaxID=3154350 RepID=UPI0033C2D82C